MESSRSPYRDQGYASDDGSSGIKSECDQNGQRLHATTKFSNLNRAEIFLTKSHVMFLNRQLQGLDAPDILKWCITTLPNLYQETAFGLSGLVILDMLSKMNLPRPSMVNLLFFDTLHHFPETLELLDRIRDRYPLLYIHIFKPEGLNTADEFAVKHGPRLWEVDDGQYDYHAKVEPAERAYHDLGVSAVLTGRRRSQGGARGDIPVLEITETGLIKVNPLANWTFDRVQEYITNHNVPYNRLIGQGYKSIGDWHSTQPVKNGDSERAGRWQGQAKTECGIHNPRSRYAQYMAAQSAREPVL